MMLAISVLCLAYWGYPYALRTPDLHCSGSLQIDRQPSEKDVLKTGLFERLTLRSSQRTIIVSSLRDLRGLVKIRDSDGALALARLDTTAVGFDLFQASEWICELANRERIHDLLSVMEPGIRNRCFSALRDGMSGMSSDAFLKSIDWEPPKVEKRDGDFYIKRFAIVGDSETNSHIRIVTLSEKVTRTGSITRIKYPLQEAPRNWRFQTLNDIRGAYTTGEQVGNSMLSRLTFHAGHL
jgi:hypothetical protein